MCARNLKIQGSRSGDKNGEVWKKWTNKKGIIRHSLLNSQASIPWGNLGKHCRAHFRITLSETPGSWIICAASSVITDLLLRIINLGLRGSLC
jgi:hypothetical protein